MRLFPRVGLISLTLATLAVACSSGGDGGPSSSEFAARYCALFEPCCQEAGLPGDGTGCRTFFGFIGANNKAAAEACISEYEARAKEQDWCTTFSTMPQPESCKLAFPQNGGGGTGSTGTKQPGEACETDEACVAPVHGEVVCRSEGGAVTRHCEQRTFVAEGESCVGTRTDSYTNLNVDTSGQYELAICNRADSLYCDAGKCAPLAPLGGECVLALGCEGDGVYCAGTCKTQVPVGQSCADSELACDDAGYCDTFGTKTCLPRKANGESCDLNTECTSHYCDGTMCTDNPGLGGLSLVLFCG